MGGCAVKGYPSGTASWKEGSRPRSFVTAICVHRCVLRSVPRVSDGMEFNEKIPQDLDIVLAVLDNLLPLLGSPDRQSSTASVGDL